MWKVIGPLLVLAALIAMAVLFFPEENIIGGGNMKINSTVFFNEGRIPSKYTCDGINTNPPLSISGIPSRAKSLVLIMYDEDSDPEDFSHWVNFNIKPSVNEIEENFEEGKQGFNDFNSKDYKGPCPPLGEDDHTYVYKVYAINTVPLWSPREPITKELVEEKIKSRIIDEAEIKGLYSRS